MFLRELKCLAQTGEHAQSQHIDLEDSKRIEVVLVPLDEGAILHRAVGDRHHFVERAARDHEAPDMLREMAREGLNLEGERLHFLHA